MSCRRRLAERDLGDGTIMSRVDTLEHAVAALTRVQVSRRRVCALHRSCHFAERWPGHMHWRGRYSRFSDLMSRLHVQLWSTGRAVNRS